MNQARPFNVRFGALTKTSVMAVIMSQSNANVSLTVNGVTETVTMTQTTADRGSNDPAGNLFFGYFGTQAFTGLTAFTEYAWTATQSGVTYTGSITTSPKKSDNFAFGIGTCFNPNTTYPDEPTAWTFFEWYRNNGSLPYIATMFTDDIYYADGTFSGPSLSWSNAEGKQRVSTAIGGLTEYDFACAYGSWFGINSPFYNPTDTAQEFPYESVALNGDFMSLMDNTAFMPSVGDHEFFNNLGWVGGTALSVVPNPYHKTAGAYDGVGLTVWNQVMAPLSGTSAQSADTNALHWYVDLGCVRYIAPDPVTNAVATTAVLGTNQINDILTIADSDQWFTFLANPSAGRGFTAYEASTTGFTYKDENYVASEYDLLFLTTGNTPKSLMDSSRTNGNMGGLVVFRGDWHQGMCSYWKAAAGGGKAAESWHEICLNSVNNSNASNDGTQNLSGSTVDLATDEVEFSGGAASVSATDHKPNRESATIIEVYGGNGTPEIIIRQYEVVKKPVALDLSSKGDTGQYFLDEFSYGDITDHTGTLWRCVFEKRIVRHTGNQGYDIGETPWQIPKIGSTGGE